MDAAIDRWVWYAGWPDKVAQVAGAANPVAGPYFNFSVPEPTGVVAVAGAAGRSSLLGLVSVLAPVIATGNTAVVVASGGRPLPAVTLAEVLATSDVPGGVVNLLTGDPAELAPGAGRRTRTSTPSTWPARIRTQPAEPGGAGRGQSQARRSGWTPRTGQLARAPAGCWRSWR